MVTMFYDMLHVLIALAANCLLKATPTRTSKLIEFDFLRRESRNEIIISDNIIILEFAAKYGNLFSSNMKMIASVVCLTTYLWY